jgi:hypothetical protein
MFGGHCLPGIGYSQALFSHAKFDAKEKEL